MVSDNHTSTSCRHAVVIIMLFMQHLLLLEQPILVPVLGPSTWIMFNAQELNNQFLTVLHHQRTTVSMRKMPV